jgi:hypothetical protein
MFGVTFAERWRLGLSGAALVGVSSWTTLAVAQSSTPEANEQKAVPASGEASAPARHGSAFVDPLGFALFGPRLGVEAGAGHLSGALHARWFNPGLLAHSLFLQQGDEFAFSYGVGLRGRYYLADGLSGLHLGVAAEYLHVRIESPQPLIATNSGYFVPYAEAGYRLALGPVYGDASAGFGYAFRTSSSVENLPGGSSASAYVVEDKSTVYGTASLELGVFF